MQPVTNLSARDLDGVLGVVAEAAAADGETPFEPAIVERLTMLVRAELLLPDPAPDLDCNARGFFFVREPGRKDFDERDRAVLTVLRSQLAAIRDRWERRRRPTGLSVREAEIAHLLREGLTNQEIADRLVISSGTVRTHLENMFEKLGVHTRTAAVARALAPAQPHDA